MNLTTRDEYGLKAGGLQNSMKTFCFLFGLRRRYVLFILVLKRYPEYFRPKIHILQDALKGICLLKVFQRQRNESAFVQFYSSVVKFYRIQYCEALDLLVVKLEDRFEQKEFNNPVLALEKLLLRAANGQEFCNQ